MDGGRITRQTRAPPYKRVRSPRLPERCRSGSWRALLLIWTGSGRQAPMMPCRFRLLPRSRLLGRSNIGTGRPVGIESCGVAAEVGDRHVVCRLEGNLGDPFAETMCSARDKNRSTVDHACPPRRCLVIMAVDYRRNAFGGRRVADLNFVNRRMEGADPLDQPASER